MQCFTWACVMPYFSMRNFYYWSMLYFALSAVRHAFLQCVVPLLRCFTAVCHALLEHALLECSMLHLNAVGHALLACAVLGVHYVMLYLSMLYLKCSMSCFTCFTCFTWGPYWVLRHALLGVCFIFFLRFERLGHAVCDALLVLLALSLALLELHHDLLALLVLYHALTCFTCVPY